MIKVSVEGLWASLRGEQGDALRNDILSVIKAVSERHAWPHGKTFCFLHADIQGGAGREKEVFVDVLLVRKQASTRIRNELQEGIGEAVRTALGDPVAVFCQVRWVDSSDANIYCYSSHVEPEPAGEPARAETPA